MEKGILLAEELVHRLTEKGMTIATAESCTGGMVAETITAVSGASGVFECGVVSYANRIKMQELSVSGETLARVGAVSEETAREMAEGVRRKAGSTIGVSTTGIAGPTGGTPEKPVGTVHIAAACQARCLHEKLSLLSECGCDREKIRRRTVERRLELALRLLSEMEENANP